MQEDRRQESRLRVYLHRQQRLRQLWRKPIRH